MEITIKGFLHEKQTESLKVGMFDDLIILLIFPRVRRSQSNRQNMGKNTFPGISTSPGREKPQTEVILACSLAFLGQLTKDPIMELMSLLNTKNVLAEMELMSLLYQEQLMLLPYYYQQSQLSSLLQQENYIFSSLSPRQTMPAPAPPPALSSEEESVGQSEPLDLSLPPSLPEKSRSRRRSAPCQCPLCGKQFSRPWLLKGKLERKLTSFVVKLSILRTHENSHRREALHLYSLS